MLPPSLRPRSDLRRALLDGPVLTLHRTPNTAQLRRSIVVERAVRLDRRRATCAAAVEIVVEQRRRKSCDSRPVVTGTPCLLRIDQISPRSNPLDDLQQVADLGSLKSGSGDPRLVEQHSRVEESTEVEAATILQACGTQLLQSAAGRC